MQGTDEILAIVEDENEQGGATQDALHSSMDDIDPDEKLKTLISDYLDKSLTMLEQVFVLQQFVLKEGCVRGSVDLGDLASQLLTLDSSFFSDTLGGANSPNNQLTGLATLEDVCASVDRLELIPPRQVGVEDSLQYEEQTLEKILEKNVISHSTIKCTINADVKGDKSGLPIIKLLELRRDQQWILQTNNYYMYAHDQPEEYRGFNEDCRKPYEEQIYGIMREALSRSKYAGQFLQALLTATEHANRLLPPVEERPKPALIYKRSKNLAEYTVLALREHMGNLTTVQKDDVRVIKMVCDVIRAVSRIMLPKLIGTIEKRDEDNSNFNGRLSMILPLIDKIEIKWHNTVYEQLVKKYSEESQHDQDILKKGAEDLSAIITALFNSTFVIKEKTRAVNIMHPVSDGPLSPLVKFGEMFYQILKRLVEEEQKFMNLAHGFAQTYSELRSEYRMKFAEKLSQSRQGLSEQLNGSSMETVDSSSRVSGGGRPPSASPSLSGHQTGFWSGNAASSVTKVSPRNGSKTSSPRSQSTSNRGSPRTPLGDSPRDVADDPLNTGGGLKSGISPPPKGDGSIRRVALRKSRAKSGVPDFGQQGQAEFVSPDTVMTAIINK